jgi:DNA-binding CsgD family transcriptional regulator
LDRSANIVDADYFGGHMLATSGVVGRARSGRLTAASAEMDREIVQIVQGMAEDHQSRPRALWLRADPWLDMLLVPVRTTSVAVPEPVAIAYLHADGWPANDCCDQLTDMFAISPTQARLTLAICRGGTVTEAASDTGITIETARSYLREIYSKTGARGLPDLLRITMSSILTLCR